jgi:hypothetical protein
MRQYKDLLDRERRRLIWIADSIVDNNPLWLLRLDAVRLEDVFPLHAQLKAMFTADERIVYYEQVFNSLRDNNMLRLLESNDAH